MEDIVFLLCREGLFLTLSDTKDDVCKTRHIKLNNSLGSSIGHGIYKIKYILRSVQYVTLQSKDTNIRLKYMYFNHVIYRKYCKLNIAIVEVLCLV